jgi:hypothetical protein
MKQEASYILALVSPMIRAWLLPIRFRNDGARAAPNSHHFSFEAKIMKQAKQLLAAVLARLHQLRGLGDAKLLKSLGCSFKGRHYRG